MSPARMPAASNARFRSASEMRPRLSLIDENGRLIASRDVAALPEGRLGAVVEHGRPRVHEHVARAAGQPLHESRVDHHRRYRTLAQMAGRHPRRVGRGRVSGLLPRRDAAVEERGLLAQPQIVEREHESAWPTGAARPDRRRRRSRCRPTRRARRAWPATPPAPAVRASDRHAAMSWGRATSSSVIRRAPGMCAFSYPARPPTCRITTRRSSSRGASQSASTSSGPPLAAAGTVPRISATASAAPARPACITCRVITPPSRTPRASWQGCSAVTSRRARTMQPTGASAADGAASGTPLAARVRSLQPAGRWLQTPCGRPVKAL